jgi:tetratricopeptide (TPR) repeat protein
MTPENGKTVNDKEQAVRLFLALRKRLRGNREGQRVISAFAQNPDLADIKLKDYLRERLPRDPELAQKISAALGEGEAINTTIIDSEIDQIINIARLGVLNLNVFEKRFYSLFKDIPQLLVFLTFVLAIGGAILYSSWRSAQPARMDGQFNIAVAEFAEIPASPFPSVAPIVSQMLFNSLDNEYQLNTLDMDIQVIHEKIGIIYGADQADKVAKKTNAHLVIYGDVVTSGDNATISPRFFVTESFRPFASELIGQHRLALPVGFTKSEIIQSEGGVNDEIRRRTAILIDFTKALVYLKLDDPSRSLNAVEFTIRQVESYGQFDGREVFYLVGAEAARRMQDFSSSHHYVEQALSANANYARAYIAQANIYYDQDELDEALMLYQKASEIKDQPYGAFIPEKANYGIGNIYAFRYQFSDMDEKPDLAAKAIDHYRFLINSYESRAIQHLKEITAWAYFMSGIMYQGEGDYASAKQAYRRSLKLAEKKELIDLTRGYLRQLP